MIDFPLLKKLRQKSLESGNQEKPDYQAPRIYKYLFLMGASMHKLNKNKKTKLNILNTLETI
jgi:hypothetical protein